MAKLRQEISLNYDDVAIYQKKNPVLSRLDVDISSEIIKGVRVDIPIIAANMSSVVNVKFYKLMMHSGAFAILHRGQSDEKRVAEVIELVNSNFKWVATSIGVGPKELTMADKLVNCGANILVIDVAHGYSEAVIDQCKYLKLKYPHVKIVVGNTMNPQLIEEVKDFVDAVKVGIGPGCLAEGTRVLMANGKYKNIEDITLKDKVLNMHGEPVEVKAVKKSGKQKVIKVKNSAFYTDTYVTNNHNYFVGDLSTIKSPFTSGGVAKILKKDTKKGENKIRWQCIQDLEKSVLLFPKKLNLDLQESFEISTEPFYLARRTFKGKIKPKIMTPSYDLGYIFGTFLGDGSSHFWKGDRVNGNGNLAATTLWFFGLKEMDIALKLKNCILSVFGIESKIVTKTSTIEVVTQANWLSRLFLEFGKKDSKHLPEKYWCNNKEYLKGLLDGLLDSDGHYSNDGTLNFTNTSKQLIELYTLLIFILKEHLPTSHERAPSVGGLKNANLNNCLPSFRSKTLLSFSKREVDNSFTYSKLTKKQFTDKIVMTYDIEVDCPTNSFIADNAIVHNSACTTKDTAGSTNGMISTILECYEIAYKYNIPIIADGGIKKPSDFSKAICAGASSIMMGGVLAATLESASQKTTDEFGNVICEYYGMASSKAQEEWKGGVKEGTCAEGTIKNFKVERSVKDILSEYSGALKSGLTYAGARTILEAHEVCELVRFK